MHQTTQIAIDFARQGQEKQDPDWYAKANDLLRKYVNFGEKFITEDFRLWAELNGLEKPKEKRAYGPLILSAVKSGLIIWTGEYKEMVASHSHGCPKKVWVINYKM